MNHCAGQLPKQNVVATSVARISAMKEDQAYLATRHIVISVTKPNRFGLALGVIDVSYEYVSIEAIKRIMTKRL